MINIKLICIGKLKEKYLTSACDEYIKRLSRFCSFTLKELGEAYLPDSPSDADIQKALKTEGAQILKEIGRDYAVALCIEGTELSSNELAEKIDKLAAEANGRLCFVIGSSHGLSDEVKKSCGLKLSFSKMTFPHQLFRVLLLEQIYRSFMINSGSKYHK